MRIGILNAYDGRNFGDRAIVEAQRAWLEMKYPGAETRVFSHHFKQNERFWKAESVRSIIGVPPSGKESTRFFTPLKDWVELRAGHFGSDDEEFMACDLYTACGGGYMYSSLAPFVSRNLMIHCINAMEAFKTGKPVLQFPQSFGPLTKPFDRHVIRRLAKALPVLVPRDQDSLDLLERMGFGQKSFLIPDIALSLRSLRPDWFFESPTRTGLGIAPVDFRFAISATTKMQEEYLAKLVQVGVEYHAKTGEAIHVFSQVSLLGDDDDSVLARNLHLALAEKGFPSSLIVSEDWLKDYLRHFQGLRAFVGCRMHSCIFAIVSHVPTIGLSYQPKFLGAFRHVGMPDWVQAIDIWTPEWVAERLDDVLRNETALRENIAVRVHELEEQIDQRLSEALNICIEASKKCRPSTVF